MKKVSVFCLVALWVIPCFAQDEPSSITPYGFASLGIPTKNSEKFDFDWARVGFAANVRSTTEMINDLDVVVEYDISTDEVKYCYVQANLKRFANGFEVSLTGGKFLSPVQYTYPGPKALPLTRWPDTSNLFKAYEEGIGVRVSREGLGVMRVAYWSNDVGEGMTAMYNLGSLWLYYDSADGSGVVVESPWKSNLFRVRAGYAEQKEGVNTSFVQNETKISRALSFWIQAQRSAGENDLLSGFVLTYAKNSFVKAFWDTQDNSAQIHLTFSF